MIAARIAVANMAAANASLEAAGYGPNNFSVPVYTQAAPTYACLHAWGPPAFETAVKAIAGVVWSSVDGAAPDRVSAVLSGISGKWGDAAPTLTGTVTPGLYRAADGALWWVIQQYNTATWPDPSVIPALVRKARVPGEVQPWVQPIDQFDAYKLVNPFTGKPDRVLHNGSEWKVTQADGSGNNVWAPGVFGWTV